MFPKGFVWRDMMGLRWRALTLVVAQAIGLLVVLFLVELNACLTKVLAQQLQGEAWSSGMMVWFGPKSSLTQKIWLESPMPVQNHCVPFQWVPAPALLRHRPLDGAVIAASLALFDALGAQFMEGKVPQGGDVRRTVLLGDDVPIAQLGDWISIQGRAFEVVGRFHVPTVAPFWDFNPNQLIWIAAPHMTRLGFQEQYDHALCYGLTSQASTQTNVHDVLKAWLKQRLDPKYVSWRDADHYLATARLQYQTWLRFVQLGGAFLMCWSLVGTACLHWVIWNGRRQEMGLWVLLGWTSTQVARLWFSECLWFAVAGWLIGFATSWLVLLQITAWLNWSFYWMWYEFACTCALYFVITLGIPLLCFRKTVKKKTVDLLKL